IDQKKRNDLEFLNFIYKNNKFNISMVSKTLGLTYPTSKRLVDDFIEEGLILVGEKELITTGRASSTFSLNSNKFYSVGVQVELNKISFILIDIFGIIKKESTILNISYENKNILKEIEELFSEFYNSIDEVILKKILGIGISFPGIVDNQKLIVINSVNLKFKNVDLGIVFKKFHQNIYLENDANACLYSEKIIGKSQDYENFVVISMGSGMGAGVYLNGKLHRGNRKLSGEFGHVSIDYKGKSCQCGNKGCWELYVSERGIEEELKKIKDLEMDILFNKEQKPDFVQEYIKLFSIGLKNIIFSFDIQNVLISGKISKYIEKYKNEIVEEVQKNEYLKGYNLNLVFSSLNHKSSSLGAALIPVSEYFNLIKKEL
ncbi:MAG: ROK family protein, partial [Cetobacterium sp.]